MTAAALGVLGVLGYGGNVRLCGADGVVGMGRLGALGDTVEGKFGDGGGGIVAFVRLFE